MENKKQLIRCIEFISEELDADAFLYSAEITDINADTLINEIKETSPKRDNIVLILTTYGGDPDAAFRIARYIKRKYQKFTLFVFGSCKSAGTLLALGADEIVMSDFGELGPLDVQVTKDDDFRSESVLDIQQALSVIGSQAFEMFESYLLKLISGTQALITTRTAADIASSMAVNLLSPISSQIDPLRLGEMNRLMNIALAYGQRLKPESIEVIKNLIYNYPSHSFVIDYEEAKKLFDDVREPMDLEYELEEMILPLVRKPSSQEIILNLEKLNEEYAENSDRNHPNRERVTQESVSSDHGKNEAVEGNILPFDKK
ncbi:SppA protein [Plectonema cf. radiosum LEGE 06105]|uniref:SppA protein n=1 Tax=Plectonema cf. radiosum LEGE 06105 TaxID=945769 RepID=A0A8J7JW15_9CYAN|nr:SppA protein [Plectonema radiosum]MBE9216404.1 SppA protein [Plectonema cf. radiosum LEGE 06105]